MWRLLLSEIADRRILQEGPYQLVLTHDKDENGAGDATTLVPPPAKHEFRLLKYYRGAMYRIYNFLQQHGRLPTSTEFQDVDLYFFPNSDPRTAGPAEERMTWGGVKVLQSLISRSTIMTPMIVYRGVGSYHEFGGNRFGAIKQAAAKIPSGTDGLSPSRRYEKMIREALDGHTHTYKRFLSTSRSMRGAESFQLVYSPGIMWRFLIDAGTPGLDVMKWIGSNWSENEILFPSGATVTILGAHTVGQVTNPEHPDALPPADLARFSYTPRELDHIRSVYPVQDRVMRDTFLATATLRVPRPTPQTLPLPPKT